LEQKNSSTALLWSTGHRNNLAEMYRPVLYVTSIQPKELLPKGAGTGFEEKIFAFSSLERLKNLAADKHSLLLYTMSKTLFIATPPPQKIFSPHAPMLPGGRSRDTMPHGGHANRLHIS